METFVDWLWRNLIICLMQAGALLFYLFWLKGKKLHQEIDAQQERIAGQVHAEQCLRDARDNQGFT